MVNPSKLEKLSVKGFKSFSKLTSLLFSPGITAIVGPNGSGKSNVLDSISFVMGSLSFSSLRAKSAGNLLHLGKTKKSTNAEITLKIKVPTNISETGNLKLGRQLSTDGTSIYRLNEKRSTRLNIIDTLESINIFPDSHNIVRQGDITRFINMNPRERRSLIEVIAGIELYEKKKHRALTDLENVETKIQKVEAVHGERMRVFTRLKEEKKKVEQFYHLKSLEERARYSLLLKRIEKLNITSQTFQEEKEKKGEKIKELEGTILNKTKDLTEINALMEKRGLKQKVEIITKLESLNFNLKRIEEEKTRNFKEIETTQNRLSSIESQIEGMSRRKKEVKQELIDKGNRRISISKKIQEYKKYRDKLTTLVSKAKQDYERKQEEYLKLKTRKEKLILQLKELSLEKNASEQINFELKKKKEEQEKRKLSLETEKKKFLKDQKERETKLKEIDSNLKTTSIKFKTLRKQEQEIIYSSSLPAGVRKLKNKGFKLLGELVDNPKEIMPFAFSIIASKNKLETIKTDLNEGWAFILPDDFNLSELKKISKIGQSLGTITSYEFTNESERNSKLQILKTSIKKIEQQIEKQKNEKFRIEARLNQKFDSYQIASLQDSLKKIKNEIIERNEDFKKLNEKIEILNTRILKLGEIKEPKILEEKRLEEISSKVFSLETETLRLNSEIKSNEDILKNLLEPELLNYEKLRKTLLEEINTKRKLMKSDEGNDNKIKIKIKSYQQKVGELDRLLKNDLVKKTEVETFIQTSNSQIFQSKAERTILDERIKNIKIELNSIKQSNQKELEIIENPKEILQEVIHELEKLGDLNFRASNDFENINNLVKDISDKLNKLRQEKDAILKLMNEIDSQKTKVFMETFNKINKNFSKIFSEIIDGESNLEIDGDDPFESGVHIITFIQGRKLPSESLSGGQKTLAAIAFIFAIQEVKPSPFYIFDEVEAALDKTNSEKFVLMLKRMSKTTQIIIITHNDVVVRESDQIIGVYMHKGRSKLISLPKEKVLKEAESWIGTKKEK